MKKIVSCFLALLLCMSLALSASAAGFTPSVTNKPAPGIVPVIDPNGVPRLGYIMDADGNIIGYLDEDCLVVTSIADADISVEIPKTAKDLLLWVYQQLMRGDMTIPYEKHNPNYDVNSMVVRDMFDITFLCGDHPVMLEQAGVVLVLTFDVGVEAGADVSVMTYKEDAWNDIEKITNNGDGTVTCTFEHLCPVAISVAAQNGAPGQTGDNSNMGLWGIIALGSLLAIAVLSIFYYRSRKIDQ